MSTKKRPCLTHGLLHVYYVIERRELTGQVNEVVVHLTDALDAVVLEELPDDTELRGFYIPALQSGGQKLGELPVQGGKFPFSSPGIVWFACIDVDASFFMILALVPSTWEVAEEPANDSPDSCGCCIPSLDGRTERRHLLGIGSHLPFQVHHTPGLLLMEPLVRFEQSCKLRLILLDLDKEVIKLLLCRCHCQ